MEGDRQRFVVTEVLEQGVKGFWFLGSGSDREERTISYDTLGDYQRGAQGLRRIARRTFLFPGIMRRCAAPEEFDNARRTPYS